MNIKKKILVELFGVAFDDDMSPADKIQWEQKAINQVAKETCDKFTFTGSEKQVAWVEKIYRSFVFEALSYEPLFAPALVKALEKKAAEHSDAKYWIDARNKKVRELLSEEYKALDMKLEESGIEELPSSERKEAEWKFIQESIAV